MKHLIAATLVCASLSAIATELTGTAYAVIYRGDAPAGAPMAMPRDLRLPGFPAARRPTGPQQQAAVGGMVRLIDAGTRRELARSVFDAKLGGYLLPMPFQQGVGNCLALVDARNQLIAVRASSAIDSGAYFRNPAWEVERSRVGDLAALQSERAAVDAQLQTSATEIARLQAELALPEGAVASDCPTPAQGADPPRPVAALDAGDVPPVAGPLCALRWEQAHGGKVDLSRMFADGGATSDWQQRGSARAIAQELPALQVPISGQDLHLVLDAAVKGRTFLEHTDGVRVFVRAHGACRDEVGRQVQAARQRWEQDIAAVRSAPQRSRQQCAQKIARVAQLHTVRRSAPEYLAALDRRVAALSTPAGVSDPAPLEAQLCQP